MTCMNCGAAVAAGADRFCSHCGAALPDAARVTAVEYSTHEERFAAAERHAAYPEAMRHTPAFRTGWTIFVGLVLAAFGLRFAAMAWTAPMTFAGLLFAALAIYVCIYKPLKLAAAPVQRSLGVVVDERIEVASGAADVNGERATSTTYYATLQFRDGQRRELTCEGAVAGQLARGDMGVTCAKEDYLAAFVRIPV